MSKYENIESQAADWIARRDGLDWSAEQHDHLQAWLDLSTANRAAYLRLDAAWRRADRLRALCAPVPRNRSIRPTAAAGKAYRALAAWSMSSRLVAGLATLVLTLMLGGDLGWNSGERTFETPVGARQTVALEDGSKLTLNTATELRAKVDPAGRMVWLDRGEAFFEIAHDASHPFVVVAGNRRVTVLGTKFSLRREGDRLEIDVLEGRVQLQQGNSATTLVTRGESAIGQGHSVLVARRSDHQLAAATSWLEGRLVFDQTTLADVAAQFNRYNRKKLVVDASAADIRIGGSFDATNIDGLARLVQAGFGLVVTSDNERIVLARAQPLRGTSTELVNRQANN